MQKGFTLIELLVVFGILSILTMIGIGNFQTARIKARDANRKSDLLTISKSLEAYVNDYKSYPLSLDGQIVCQPPNTTCPYGSSFRDDKGTIYAAKLPADPVSSASYYYESDGITYTLYARLENAQDPAIDNTLTQTCGNFTCNYQIKSSNQL